MKYTLTLNQNRSVEWKLTASEAIVFSWIYELPSWADKMEYNGVTYYFGSRNIACKELPIITDKVDTMYRLYKSLEKKDLISMVVLEKKDYIAITEKGKKWHYENELPSNGKKSEETRNEIRENSEINPTNKYTIDKDTSNKIKEDTSVSKKVAIDYDFIKSEWERINPNLASIRGLNDKRKTAIKKLLKKNNASVSDLIKAFEVISICSFCNGSNNRCWKATFDWIINDTKSCFNRLLEGEYIKGRYEREQFDALISGESQSFNTNNSNSIKFQF